MVPCGAFPWSGGGTVSVADPSSTVVAGADPDVVPISGSSVGTGPADSAPSPAPQLAARKPSMATRTTLRTAMRYLGFTALLLRFDAPHRRRAAKRHPHGPVTVSSQVGAA